MSEALEKVQSVRQLPVFPLPLVMMPGELIPLHIFEDRYRKMLRDVETNTNFFGITYSELQGSDPPEEGSVGCFAEVRESEVLPDGRSNIVVQGIVRYRLEYYIDSDEPYLIAFISAFEDDADDSEKLDKVAEKVFDSFGRLASAAFRMSGNRGPLPEIQRTAPEALSFMIAAALNLNNAERYRLLNLTSTYERLSWIDELLDRTIDQIEESSSLHSAARSNGHSKKKLDL